MAKNEMSYERDGIPRVFDCNLDTPTYLLVRGDEKNPRKDRGMAPGVPEILAFEKLAIVPVKLPPKAHNPGLRPWCWRINWPMRIGRLHWPAQPWKNRRGR